MEERVPAARDLLNLCAFLAPDDIPFDVIVEQASELPAPLSSALADDLDRPDVVAAAQRYSLIDADGDLTSLSMHRLVQLVTRDRLNEDEQQLWAGAAVRVIGDAYSFESDDVRYWPSCARLLPHGMTVSAYADELNVDVGRSSWLRNQMALYLSSRSRYSEARALHERALAAQEAALGPDHSNVATSRNNLALVLRAQGDLAGARELHERALATYQQWPTSYGEGVTLWNLGKMAEVFERPREGLRLLIACYVVDAQLGHPAAEAQDLPAVREAAAALGYDEAGLAALIRGGGGGVRAGSGAGAGGGGVSRDRARRRRGPPSRLGGRRDHGDGASPGRVGDKGSGLISF